MKRERPRWPDRIHRVLRAARVRQVAYVPDAGHARLIELVRADRAMRAVPLTTEEEGVALAAGAWLGGERAALLMQSSGAGNCINMLGMIRECRFPLLMLVTMRGQWGEFNPWQVPMGQATRTVLEAMSTVVQVPSDEKDIAPTVNAALRLAYECARTPGMRKLASFFWPGERVLSRPDDLGSWIFKACGSGYHPCGTVPMGRDGDPAARHRSPKVAAVRGENRRTASIPPSVKLARVSVDSDVAILAS